MLNPDPTDPDADGTGPKKPMTPGERMFLIGFCLLLFGGFAAEILRDFGPARAAVPLFFVFWMLLTMLHEAGHAVVAHAVGWQVDRVQLGFGPVLGRAKPGGVPVEIRAFPIVGLVSMVPRDLSWARLKNALIYAAGPGVELILAAIVASAVGWDVILSSSDDWGVVAAQALCLAAVMGAGLNLIPFSPRRGVVTDGLGILLSPVMPRVHFEAMMVRPQLAEALELIANGEPAIALGRLEQALARHPGVIVLHAAAARALVALGRREEALLRLQALVRETNPDDRPEAERALEELRGHLDGTPRGARG